MSKKNRNGQKPKIFNDIDIVIPVYGQFDVLGQGLSQLPQATKNVSYKVYMCDDVSPDIETIGKQFYSGLRNDNRYSVMYHKTNMGFGKSCNDAATLGSAKYILVHSTDVILTEDAVRIMYEHIENNPQIGIVAPKLLFFPNTKDSSRPAGRVQSVGIFFGPDSAPYHPFIGWDHTQPLVNIVRDVNAITGATFLIRRNVWQQLKGFSLDYGRGTYEDLDLCFRTRMAGYTIRVLPQAVGFHYTNLSVLSAKTPEESFPIKRNADIFTAKFGNIIPFDGWYLSGILNE